MVEIEYNMPSVSMIMYKIHADISKMLLCMVMFALLREKIAKDVFRCSCLTDFQVQIIPGVE